MHEDDSAGGESLISPAGPSDDATPPAGLPGDVTGPRFPATRGRPLTTRSPSRASALLIYLVVAALAAAAGVGTTLAVQHATAARPGAARRRATPRRTDRE